MSRSRSAQPPPPRFSSRSAPPARRIGAETLLAALHTLGVAAGGVTEVDVGAVHSRTFRSRDLTANTVASAAPTPGGVGAIEAALLAVLTGIQVESGTALSIVLVFRVFSYWLPIAPSWFFLQRLREQGVV